MPWVKTDWRRGGLLRPRSGGGGGGRGGGRGGAVERRGWCRGEVRHHLSRVRQRSARHQNAIDGVDDSVRLQHVVDADIRYSAGLVLNADIALPVLGEGQGAAARGLEHRRPIALADQLVEIHGRVASRYHVIGQYFRELSLVFRLEQRIHSAGGQRRKRRIDRSEHRERTLALQRVDQARGFDRGDEGSVILRIDGVLDDVL